MMLKIIGVDNISKFIGVSNFKFFGHGVASLSPYTKLLLKTTGDGSITDVTGKAVTVAGNTNISTAQSIIGGSSIYFDGSGDYLSLADSDDWFLDAGDFTIDAWVYFNAYTTNTNYPVFTQYVDNDNFLEFTIADGAPNMLRLFVRVGGLPKAYYLYNWSANINTWYHIAVSRVGSRINVTIIQSVLTYSIPNLASNFYIGYSQRDAAYFNGYLSHIRITKGLARWTSNFTPPTTDAEYLN